MCRLYYDIPAPNGAMLNRLHAGTIFMNEDAFQSSESNEYTRNVTYFHSWVFWVFLLGGTYSIQRLQLCMVSLKKPPLTLKPHENNLNGPYLCILVLVA